MTTQLWLFATQFWLMLLGASITVVFVRGSIFQPLRGPTYRAKEAESRIVSFFRDWASCSLCSGVWVGAAVSLAHDHGGIWDYVRALDLLGFSCASGVLAVTIYSLLDWLQAPHWEAPAQQAPQQAGGWAGAPQLPAQHLAALAAQAAKSQQTPITPENPAPTGTAGA